MSDCLNDVGTGLYTGCTRQGGYVHPVHTLGGYTLGIYTLSGTTSWVYTLPGTTSWVITAGLTSLLSNNSRVNLSPGYILPGTTPSWVYPSSNDEQQRCAELSKDDSPGRPERLTWEKDVPKISNDEEQRCAELYRTVRNRAQERYSETFRQERCPKDVQR